MIPTPPSSHHSKLPPSTTPTTHTTNHKLSQLFFSKRTTLHQNGSRPHLQLRCFVPVPCRRLPVPQVNQHTSTYPTVLAACRVTSGKYRKSLSLNFLSSFRPRCSAGDMRAG